MKKLILLIFGLGMFSQNTFAQKADEKAAPFKPDSIKMMVPSEGKKTRLLPSLIAPAILIGYGITTVKDQGLYSSYHAQADIMRLTGGRGSTIDNYLQFSPYVEFAALLALKVKCKNDALNTALLIAKSEIIMSAMVFPLKYMIKEERPYSHDKAKAGVSLEERKKDPNAFVSMPSGHTANAFCAATIVYREFRYKSAWYGIGAYTLATSVAAFRMINNQHWESDVLVGAGIGILSTNIVYATHLHRWGRKEVCFVPVSDGGYNGLVFNCTF